MIKTILVPLSVTAANDPVFAASLWAARLFGGHIDFLYARVEPAEAATQAAEFLGGAIASDDMIKRLEAAAAKREAEAVQAYRSFCESERLAADAAAGAETVSVAWHRETGRAADWVAEYGRTSDLLVVGRPVANILVTTQILEAALLDSGRPVLVPGSVPPALDTIAVAWRPAREAACAVTAAMPFLARAKRIVVLAAPNHDSVDRAGCERLVGALRRHCSVVDASYLEAGSRDVGAALLAAAGKEAAGLLVMGAYGHWRMRELLFGGVTEHVLHGAEVPVLMAH
jgi:nucleotide-binding universal stress UspA family protein